MNCSSVRRDNLLSCVAHREIGDFRDTTNSLRSICDKHIQKNISNDLFFSYHLDLENQNQIFRINRNHQFIAFNKSDKIILYDLLACKILWNCQLEMREGHLLDNLVVSRNGMVHVITEDKKKCFENKNLHIFSEGKQIRTIDIDIKTIFCASLKAINENFFAYSAKTYVDKIFVWGKEGSYIGDIRTNQFSEGPIQASVSNKNFYVLTAGTPNKPNTTETPNTLVTETVLNKSSFPARVFVLDLITGKQKIFDLEYQYGIEIASVALKRNIL
ncbi:MAG: hypothetical protein H0U49_03670, partial [Parachlamydiaceae bacterium]|nr:hypothetical protein [Parachlamydiaceae bacterium]